MKNVEVRIQIAILYSLFLVLHSSLMPNYRRMSAGGDEMIPLQGTIRNGQIVLDAPAQLPEGTRVDVLPIEVAHASLGMREEDWPTTPDGILALIARMDQLEPGWLSAELR